MTFRLWLLRLRTATASVLIGAVAVGAVGQVVRDRSALWALGMYVPLTLLGGAALGLDLLARGRSVPGARGLLAAVGLVALIGGSAPLLGFGPRGDAPGITRGGTPDLAEVAVLHWNVVWGGGSNPAWGKLLATILEKAADVVILSEAPSDTRLDDLVRALGPAASRTQIVHGPEAVHGPWFRLVVASRWPVRGLGRVNVVNGHAMAAEVDVRGRTLRILVVDGLSHPTLHRGPFLQSIVRVCESAKQAGAPYDLVAGDFNCVGRSLGLDGLDQLGYALAGRSARGWRATFPSFLPIYDIDHLWIRNDVADLRDTFFTNLASDHRGQVARFRWRDGR